MAHRAKGRRFSVVSMKEEHAVQHPNALLTTLSKMTLKPEVTFDKLFQKLYNVELWLLAYQLRKIRRAGYAETCKSGSEGVSVKPDVAIC